MPNNRYLMRDFNDDKIDSIMRFNVAQRHSRSRSILEFSVFLVTLLGYLGMLALSA